MFRALENRRVFATGGPSVTLVNGYFDQKMSSVSIKKSIATPGNRTRTFKSEGECANQYTMEPC